MHLVRPPSAMAVSLVLSLLTTVSAIGQQPATLPAPQPDATPKVTLLKPGASPRQTLRLTPREGATGVIDLTMHIVAKQLLDGAEQQQPPSPPVLMSFKTAVSKVDGDRIEYTFECVEADLVEDANVPEAIREILRSGITIVAGIRGTGVVTDRAVSLGATVTRAPGMDPGLLQHAIAIERLLDQVTTPLPVEPVGLGGVWEVASTLDEQGLIVHESITCTLMASDGNTVEIATVIKRHADPQPVRDPNIPPGGSADLTVYEFAGTGRATLRLDELLPVKGNVNVKADSTVVMKFGDARHEVTQNVTIATELKGK